MTRPPCFPGCPPWLKHVQSLNVGPITVESSFSLTLNFAILYLAEIEILYN
jgi:hypothetical protein